MGGSGFQAVALLTGFEPFRHHVQNSSWECVSRVAAMYGGVEARLLPVDHHSARQQLVEHLQALRPQLCLCTWLAEGDDLRVELQARKPQCFAGLPGEPVQAGCWPSGELLQELQGQGCPARASEDAGRYVCESTYWSLLDFRQRHGFPRWAGFLHVPPLSERFPVQRLVSAVDRVLSARLQAIRGDA